jgi:DNA-directed RNA polymerase specialized sigma24 family protein
MHPDLESALEQRDFEDIYLRVALHSYNVYCGYFWRGRSLKRKEHEIPCIDGKGPDDLLGDALAKLLSGERTYDPRQSFEINLKRAVESLIWNHVKKVARVPIRVLEDSVDGSPYPVESIPDSVSLSPSDEDLKRAEADWIKEIKRSLDGDNEMLDLIACLELDIYKSSEISQTIDLPVEKVYELKRSLAIHVRTLFGVPNFEAFSAVLKEGR